MEPRPRAVKGCLNIKWKPQMSNINPNIQISWPMSHKPKHQGLVPNCQESLGGAPPRSCWEDAPISSPRSSRTTQAAAAAASVLCKGNRSPAPKANLRSSTRALQDVQNLERTRMPQYFGCNIEFHWKLDEETMSKKTCVRLSGLVIRIKQIYAGHF